MVLLSKMEAVNPEDQVSKPIDIPDTKRVLAAPESGSPGNGSPRARPNDDRAPDSEDEIFEIPEGSPYFVSVMNDLSLEDRTEKLLPLSPLALSGLSSQPDQLEHEEKLATSSDAATTPPVLQKSPAVLRRRVGSASAATSPGNRSRSYSWNYRYKMAMERRNAMKLTVPGQSNSGPSSTNSSPLVKRRQTKAKSQPGTPKVTRLVPKYKFLTESISVSHEDIVREQQRERHLADGFFESKSIFGSKAFDRFGESPV